MRKKKTKQTKTTKRAKPVVSKKRKRDVSKLVGVTVRVARSGSGTNKRRKIQGRRGGTGTVYNTVRGRDFAVTNPRQPIKSRRARPVNERRLRRTSILDSRKREEMRQIRRLRNAILKDPFMNPHGAKRKTINLSGHPFAHTFVQPSPRQQGGVPLNGLSGLPQDLRLPSHLSMQRQTERGDELFGDTIKMNDLNRVFTPQQQHRSRVRPSMRNTNGSEGRVIKKLEGMLEGIPDMNVSEIANDIDWWPEQTPERVPNRVREPLSPQDIVRLSENLDRNQVYVDDLEEAEAQGFKVIPIRDLVDYFETEGFGENNIIIPMPESDFHEGEKGIVMTSKTQDILREQQRSRTDHQVALIITNRINRYGIVPEEKFDLGELQRQLAIPEILTRLARQKLEKR